MKKITFPLLISVVLVTLVKCEDEQSVPREYPRVTGMVVANVSENGATFMADLYSAGTETLVEHGFVWGKWSGAKNLSDYDRVYLGVPQTGKFQAEVRTTFTKDQTYYVRPFIVTEERIVYGPEAPFQSLGSEGPLITGFEPETGIWGDTLRIYGHNFSWVRNEIFLNDVKCSEISSTDTSIIAIIERDVITIDNDVSVSIDGNKYIYTGKKFKLFPPLIKDFYPKQGFWGDTITIKGSVVSWINSQTSTVSLGSFKCGVFSINLADSTAKILVPADVNTIGCYLTVTINNYNTAASEPFTLLPPHFTIYPLDGTWKSIITLKGRFHPKSTANLIKVGGYDAKISSFNKDSIKITIPDYLVNHKNAVSLSSPPFTIVATDSFRLAKPVITSISPVSGPANSGITVKGRYIRNYSVYNFTKIKFGDFSVSFTSSNDSILFFNVPYNTPNGAYKITVIAGNQVAESQESFNVLNPVITDFSPKTATFNDVITIYGENFVQGTGVTVRINGVSSSPLSITSSVIQVQVPSYLNDSIPGSLSVSFNGATAVSKQLFTLSPPVITSVSPGTITSAGQEIIIDGSGFNPAQNYNQVYWDIYPLTIKSSSASRITATLPLLMSGNDARIRIRVAGYQRFSDLINNDIISKWNKLANFSKGLLYIPGGISSFSILGRGYLLEHNSGRTTSFDPLTGTFENLGVNSSLAFKTGLSIEVCNDTAYLMGHDLGLHRFDMELKKWIPSGASSPMPGNNFFGVLFSLNGKIFYGLASPYTSDGYLNRSLWEFDNNLKTWKQKASLPGITSRFPAAYFSLNNKGYVLFVDNKFCEYDPVTDSWTLLQDYPADINYRGRSAMVIGGKAYVGLGGYYSSYSDKIHVYDRDTDSWSLFSRIPYGGRSNACTFVINNKGYVFSGITNYTWLYEDLLEFDPSIE